MKVSFRTVQNSIKKFQQGLVSVSVMDSAVNVALTRDVSTVYKNAQRTRWATENTSEGPAWKALNPKYAASKPKRYASYPGGGRKMLMATGLLFQNTTGEDRQYYREYIEGRRFIISVGVPYAKWVNEIRPFMKFGEETKQKVRNVVHRHINAAMKSGGA